MWCMHSSSTCSSSRQPQQRGAEERPAREVERPRRLLAGAPPDRRLAIRLAQPRQVVHRQREAAERRDHLHRRAVHLGGRSSAAPRGAGRSRPARAPAPPRPARRRAATPRGRCRRRSPAPAGRGTRAAPARTTAAARPSRSDRHRPAGSTGSSARRISSTALGQLRHRGRPRRAPRSGSSTPNTLADPRRPPASPAASARPGRRSLSSTPTRSRPQHLGPDPRQHLLRRRPRRHVALRRRPRAPAPAAPCGPACRWRSAAARPGRRTRHGTMYSGRLRRRCVAQRLRPPRRPPRTPPAAGRPARPRARRRRSRAPPGAGAARASISPSSMRKPRIFTCSSRRPRYSSVAVRQPPHPVARAVQPRARRRERIGDEALGRQLRAVQVAARHARAAHVQLARHARPAPAAAPASSTYSRRSGMRPPIGLPRAADDVLAAERPIGHVHGGLGDPVHVHQPRRLGAAALHPLAQRGGLQRLAAEDHHAQRQRRRPARRPRG